MSEPYSLSWRRRGTGRLHISGAPRLQRSLVERTHLGGLGAAVLPANGRRLRHPCGDQFSQLAIQVLNLGAGIDAFDLGALLAVERDDQRVCETPGFGTAEPGPGLGGDAPALLCVVSHAAPLSCSGTWTDSRPTTEEIPCTKCGMHQMQGTTLKPCMACRVSGQDTDMSSEFTHLNTGQRT